MAESVSSSSSHAEPVKSASSRPKVAAIRGDSDDEVTIESFPSYCCFTFMSYVMELVMTAAIGSFLFGFNLSLLNTSLNHINIDYNWCGTNEPLDTGNYLPANIGCDAAKWYGSFLSTAVFIGAAAGSMTAGGFLFLGRRRVFLLSMVIFAFGIINSVVANSFAAITWARLVVGYGVGIVSFIAPMYIAEMSPKDKRGTLGVFHQLFITIGIFIAVLIGYGLSSIPAGTDDGYDKWRQSTFDRVWWRCMLGVGILPVLQFWYLFTKVYTFETPNYYVEQGQVANARALLTKIKGNDDVQDEIDSIQQGVRDQEEAKANGLSLGKAFSTSKYQYVIIVGCLLSGFQQLSGINAFIASSNKLFGQAGASSSLQTTLSTAMTALNVLMTFPALPLIEKMGRKSLLLMGTIGQTVGVAPAAIMFWVDPTSDVTNYLAIAGVYVFVIFFAMAYGPVLWVYLMEIYPAEIKGAAAGLATAFNWIFGIVMVFASGFVEENKINFTLYTIMNFIAILIVVFMVKETKGRDLQDSPYMNNKSIEV